MRSSCAIPRASLRVGLDHHGRQRRLYVPRLEQHHLEPSRDQTGMQPLRQRPRFQPDPPHPSLQPAEEPDQGLRLARHLCLAHDLADATTTHTLLCSNDTSIPAKCSMTVLRACLEPTNSDSASHHHSGGQSPRRGFWRRPITASSPPLPRPADTFWSRQDSTLVISKQSRHGYRQNHHHHKGQGKGGCAHFCLQCSLVL